MKVAEELNGMTHDSLVITVCRDLIVPAARDGNPTEVEALKHDLVLMGLGPDPPLQYRDWGT